MPVVYDATNLVLYSVEARVVEAATDPNLVLTYRAGGLALNEVMVVERHVDEEDNLLPLVNADLLDFEDLLTGAGYTVQPPLTLS